MMLAKISSHNYGNDGIRRTAGILKTVFWRILQDLKEVGSEKVISFK